MGLDGDNAEVGHQDVTPPYPTCFPSRVSGSQVLHQPIYSRRSDLVRDRQKFRLAQELHNFVAHNHRCLDAVPMANATQNLQTLV